MNLKIEGQIWEMKEGKTTAIKVGEEIFRSVTSDTRYPQSSFNAKETYLSKWIRKNNITIFTIDDFYKAYPKQKDRKKQVDRYISEMIADDKLLQTGKDKFKVTKHMEDGS